MKKPIPKKSATHPKQLQKCPTGIKGFDEITEGGLPKNRTTLVSGGAGSGKTLLGLDFLINGAIQFKEPGVFMSFEETEDELYTDVASLNLDLRGLVSRKKILIEHVLLEKKIYKRLTLTWKGYSCVWNMLLIPSVPNGLF